ERSRHDRLAACPGRSESVAAARSAGAARETRGGAEANRFLPSLSAVARKNLSKDCVRLSSAPGAVAPDPAPTAGCARSGPATLLPADSTDDGAARSLP